MEGKQTKGRQKIEMKRIENEDDRLITFSKRRSGIYKKSSELVTLCGAEVGVVIFSPSGKPFSFAHPSIESIANRFLNQNPPQTDNTHPLVEAHRRVRIDELNQQHNDLHNQLEAEKERGKELQMLARARGNQQGWWETPLEELGFEELQNMHASLEELHRNICNHVKGRSRFPMSSSSFHGGAGTSAQGSMNPFLANASATHPPGYGYGRQHF
ncbi:agamous-like MADS-box protein AGL62 [Ziziphus jujuba]|uniref:Agamous-like MADS-box protein AGL62 n=1 Tax=Ziziphus jujuba TaxID=326968 RepID=A0A6P3ZN99_ZIZJJ|nr:agamous-like MADS-box protein AGL62 [Ziziphus jujuba]